jgi:ABC-type multidrug transport system permease subunit
MSSLMSALLFGSIYWRMGYTQSTIQDRLGLLQVCCINAAMSALVKTLQVFGAEREIVSRERAGGAYDIFPYFSSKLMAELPVSAVFPLVFSAVVYPMCGLSGGVRRVAQFMGLVTLESFTSAAYGLFVGSIAPTPEAAVAIGPASFVIFIVFGGLYVNGDNVPPWLAWLPRVSIIKHAFEGLCVNEFRGIQFDSKRPWDVRTGEQQLARLGWADSSIAKSCVSQARVLVINYLLTYAVLKVKAPQYQPLVDPAAVEGVTDGKVAGGGPAAAIDGLD